MEMTRDNYEEVNNYYVKIDSDKLKRGFWSILLMNYKRDIIECCDNKVPVAIIRDFIIEDFKKRTSTELDFSLSTLRRYISLQQGKSKTSMGTKKELVAKPSSVKKKPSFSAPEETPKVQDQKTTTVFQKPVVLSKDRYPVIKSLDEFSNLPEEIKLRTDLELLKPYIYFLVKEYALKGRYVPEEIRIQFRKANKLLLKKYFIDPAFADVENPIYNEFMELIKEGVKNMKDAQDLDWICLR